MPRANQAKQLLTNPSITPQKFEHAALLFNVCLTTGLRLVHILYLIYGHDCILFHMGIKSCRYRHTYLTIWEAFPISVSWKIMNWSPC